MRGCRRRERRLPAARIKVAGLLVNARVVLWDRTGIEEKEVIVNCTRTVLHQGDGEMMNAAKRSTLSTLMGSTCRGLAYLPFCTSLHHGRTPHNSQTHGMHKDPFGCHRLSTCPYLGIGEVEIPSQPCPSCRSQRQSKGSMSQAWCWQHRGRR
jgi:hypothetical protein